MKTISGAYAGMLALHSPDPDLTTVDRAIYATLVFRSNGKRSCCKSHEDLMADVPSVKTRQTVNATLRKLAKRGYISVKRQRFGPNSYFILDPDGYLYGDAESVHRDPANGDAESVHRDPAHDAHGGAESVHRAPPATAPNGAESTHHNGAESVHRIGAESVHQESYTKERTQEGTQQEPAPRARGVDDLAKELWDEGVPIITRVTGKMNGSANKLMGRFRKLANDDLLVLDALREADRHPPASDPIAYIVGIIQAKLPAPLDDEDITLAWEGFQKLWSAGKLDGETYHEFVRALRRTGDPEVIYDALTNAKLDDPRFKRPEQYWPAAHKFLRFGPWTMPQTAEASDAH